MSKLVGAAVTATLCLLLAACGGGSSNTNSAADTTSSEPSATVSDTSGAVRRMELQQLRRVGGRHGRRRGGVGPTSGGTDLSSMSDFLREVSAGAPADLRDDFTTLADGLQKFYDTLKAAGIDLTDPNTYSSQSAGATLSKAAQQLQKDVGDAATRIQTRFQELCGNGG